MGLLGLVDEPPALLPLALLGFLIPVFYHQSLFAPMDIILP
jgi:hypothetical protein